MRMRGRVRGNQTVVIELYDRTEQNKWQCSGGVRPSTRQQNASNNDDQWVKKIEGTVDATGHVHDHRDKNQVGHNLQRSLDAVFLPDGQQQDIEQW
jgi:hypothetical protein